MTPEAAAAKALREVAEDARTLRVHAIDSPAYRHGARDALTALLGLIEDHARHVVHAVSCSFPDCHRTADPDTGMCGAHKGVRVAGSYVDDNHLEGGHG